jgi:hypothetical protein
MKAEADVVRFAGVWIKGETTQDPGFRGLGIVAPISSGNFNQKRGDKSNETELS